MGNNLDTNQEMLMDQPQKTKIGLYLITFIAIFFLHVGFILFTYVPIAPAITASIDLIVLGLLFYEIYKKYSDLNFTKYFLLIFVIIWGLLVFSQIEYFPSKTIIVKNAFDKPIANVAISVDEYMGETCCNPGGSQATRRYTNKIYVTDTNGKAVLSPRFYFGERKAINTIASINSNVKIVPKEMYGGASVDISKRNIDHKKIYEVVLAQKKGDYRECNQVLDKDTKSKCLSETLLYTAIKEKNSDPCKLYDNKNSEIYNECLMFIGLLQNNSQICDDVKNVVRSPGIYEPDLIEGQYKDYCKCLFDSNYCNDYYKNEFDSLRPSFIRDMHNYLCEKTIYTYDNGKTNERYKHDAIRYINGVSWQYRELGFCN